MTGSSGGAKPSVLLTRRLPQEVMDELERHVHLEVHEEDRSIHRNELLQHVAGKDGLLCLLTDTVDAEVMAAGSDLRIISNYAVGFDNIDVEAANAQGILVTNTPDVLTKATAELAFTLLLTVARRVVEGDRLVRSGTWTGWQPLQLLGGEVSGANLGLVGLGRIGRAMIPLAQGFDMQVSYWSRTRLSRSEEVKLGVNRLELPELLAASDFVSLHIALTPDTHHLIGAYELAQMKSSAYLINTARGPVLDESALLVALREKRIAGAALDVYEREPVVTEGLLELDNIVLAPHLGSATRSTRIAMGLRAVHNLLAGLRGEVPPDLVNRPLHAAQSEGSRI